MTETLKKLKSAIWLPGILCTLIIAGFLHCAENSSSASPAAVQNPIHNAAQLPQLPEKYFILPGNITSIFLPGTVRRNDNSNAIPLRRTAADNKIILEITTIPQQSESYIFAAFIYQNYLKNSLPARAGPPTV